MDRCCMRGERATNTLEVGMVEELNRRENIQDESYDSRRAAAYLELDVLLLSAARLLAVGFAVVVEEWVVGAVTPTAAGR